MLLDLLKLRHGQTKPSVNNSRLTQPQVDTIADEIDVAREIDHLIHGDKND